MSKTAKLIPLFSMLVVLLPRESAKKKLSPFECEIQKMPGGKEGREKVLNEYFTGKGPEPSERILKSGIAIFEENNGEKPEKNES